MQLPTNAILDTLVELDRLRRGLEQAFPDARAFVRPGFLRCAEGLSIRARLFSWPSLTDGYGLRGA